MSDPSTAALLRLLGSVADLHEADLTLIGTTFPTLLLHPRRHVVPTQGSSKLVLPIPAFNHR